MPVNGISVNTLKKDKSLSGKERIPVYTTTKSIPTKFTTVDEIVAQANPQVIVDGTTITGDGTTGNPLTVPYQTPLVDNVTITGSGTMGDPLVAVSSGGTVTYANVFFVDPTNGSDSTGLINRFDKPYLTYSAASTAALALSPTVSTPALVVLRKGTYTDNMLLRPYVYISCDKGVTFTVNGFYDDINTVYCRIYGEACFYNNAQPLQQNFGSDVYMEFDEAIQEATMFRGLIVNYSTLYTPKTVVVCNRLESNCKNGYLITMRYGADATIYVRQWIKGPGKLINTVFLSGLVKIYCPRTISDNRTSTVATTNKSCVVQQGATTGVLEIYGDLINISNNFSYSPGSAAQQSCLSSLQCSGGITRVFGNIYAGDTFGIYTIVASGSEYMNYDIKGNISSKSIPVCGLGTANKFKVEGEIIKTAEPTIANPCIYLTNNCEFYGKNLLLKNQNTAVVTDIVTLATVNNKAYFYNTEATSNSAGLFVNSTVGATLGCVATTSDKAIGSTIVSAFTPQGFQQVAGLTLPNF